MGRRRRAGGRDRGRRIQDGQARRPAPRRGPGAAGLRRHGGRLPAPLRGVRPRRAASTRCWRAPTRRTSTRRRRGSASCSPPRRCRTRSPRPIVEAYEELCLRCVDVNVPTAVRSSATGEDAADASFAGIFDTYLGRVRAAAGAGRDPGLLGVAVHRPRARLPAAQGDQPPRHAHRRRRDRADPRARVRRGVLGAPGHRQAGPGRHRDVVGLGRGDRAGARRPGPHRGRQVRRAGAEVRRRAQEGGVGVRLRRRPRHRDRHARQAGRPPRARRRADRARSPPRSRPSRSTTATPSTSSG